LCYIAVYNCYQEIWGHFLSQIQVNGMVTLDYATGDYCPYSYPQGGRYIITPFFNDVDFVCGTSRATGSVYYTVSTGTPNHETLHCSRLAPLRAPVSCLVILLLTSKKIKQIHFYFIKVFYKALFWVIFFSFFALLHSAHSNLIHQSSIISRPMTFNFLSHFLPSTSRLTSLIS